MFMMKRIFTKGNISLAKNFSSSTKLVEVTQDDKTGISIISMNRAPVNGLNLELLDALNTALKNAKKNDSTGIILTSSLPKIFSAGLDIMEMYKPDLKRAGDFWNTLQDTWLTLYGHPLPVAAAINGASPAGGCLLSISCEYRVFAEGKHTIGLNETKLGIVAPKWFQDAYTATIGDRQSELALLRGSLFTPEQALKIGLVDELATDKSDAIVKCQKYIADFAKIFPQARGATKLELRKEALTWLQENRKFDTDIFLKYIQMPLVQAGLDAYIQSLKQKSR